MKKFLAIVFATLVVAMMTFPVFADFSSAERENAPVVSTLEDLPNPLSSEAADLIFVEGENAYYAKVYDFTEGTYKYVPEDEVPVAGVDFVAYTMDPAAVTWVKGSEEGKGMKSVADFAKFVSVTVDGVVIDALNYTAVSGSTDVTFAPAYLETLEVGDHEVMINSTDGYATGTLTIVESGAATDTESGTGAETAAPAPGGNGQGQGGAGTGDTTNTAVWTAISLISVGAIGIIAVALVRTRKSSNK